MKSVSKHLCTLPRLVIWIQLLPRQLFAVRPNVRPPTDNKFLQIVSSLQNVRTTVLQIKPEVTLHLPYTMITLRGSLCNNTNTFTILNVSCNTCCKRHLDSYRHNTRNKADLSFSLWLQCDSWLSSVISVLHNVPLIPFDFITPINDAHKQLHFLTTSFSLGKYKPKHQVSYPVFKHTIYVHVKCKTAPLQARRGPEGSRKLRFRDFVTTA